MSKQHPGSPARQQKPGRSQAQQARRQLSAGGLSHQRRRGEFRHLIIVAAGTIAAMAIVAAGVGLVSAIEAAGGQGTAGTFIVGQPCIHQKGGCAWTGTFQSPNGATVQHASYNGTLPAGAGVGSSVPAIEPAGSSGVVYPPHSSHAWVSDLLLIVLAGGVVGLLLWISPLGLGDREAGAIV